MKNCSNIKKYFDRALYGELNDSDKEKFESHLEECGECRAEFKNLRNTLEIINERERTETDPVFMDNFWNKLEPKLNQSVQTKETFWEKVYSLFTFENRISYQAAGAIAILLIGIVIGKYFLSGDQNELPEYSNQVQNEQVIQARAERYLDRSKVLLLGLMNFDVNSDDIGAINLSHHQKISNELITEAAELQNDLKGNPNQQLKRLIEEVEVILMQIANLEMENDLSGIELIKAGVDRRGIFLKINIQELNSEKTSSETPESTKSNENEIKS